MKSRIFHRPGAAEARRETSDLCTGSLRQKINISIQACILVFGADESSRFSLSLQASLDPLPLQLAKLQTLKCMPRGRGWSFAKDYREPKTISEPRQVPPVENSQRMWWHGKAAESKWLMVMVKTQWAYDPGPMYRPANKQIMWEGYHKVLNLHCPTLGREIF